MYIHLSHSVSMIKLLAKANLGKSNLRGNRNLLLFGTNDKKGPIELQLWNLSSAHAPTP